MLRRLSCEQNILKAVESNWSWLLLYNFLGNFFLDERICRHEIHWSLYRMISVQRWDRVRLLLQVWLRFGWFLCEHYMSLTQKADLVWILKMAKGIPAKLLDDLAWFYQREGICWHLVYAELSHQLSHTSRPFRRRTLVICRYGINCFDDCNLSVRLARGLPEDFPKELTREIYDFLVPRYDPRILYEMKQMYNIRNKYVIF